MYQGKFSNHQQGRSTSDLLAERAAQNPKNEPMEPAVPSESEDSLDFLGTIQEPSVSPSVDDVDDLLFTRPASQPGTPRPAQRPMQQAAPGAAPQKRPAPNGMPPHRPASPNGAPQHRPAPGGMPQNRPASAPGGMPPHHPASGRVPPKRPMPNQGAAPSQRPAPRPKSLIEAQVAHDSMVRHHTRVFYTCYFSFIFVFFVITFCGLLWLKGWLTDYEAAQPSTAANAFFQMYFADPNWGLIYDNAVNKNAVGDRSAFISYMEDKVGDSQLTYQETSAGLSNNKKFFIKLGTERVASFVMAAEGETEHITDIPDWKLGDIELIVKHDNTYYIRMLEGHTAYLNGEKLDESHTIMKATTAAQDFLPEGTPGIKMWVQQVDNQIGKPNIKITDEKGQEMEVEYNAQTKTFQEVSPSSAMTEEQKTAIVDAAKVYGEYMISQASRAELAKHFDSSSTNYAAIRDQEKIVQKSFYQGHSFGEPAITEFTMYSDEIFSAHISIKLNVTRTDGTVKEFPIDTTMFFAKQSTGKWLVYDMTNQDVQKPVGKVRLTFMNGDQVLSSDFYDSKITELDTPMVSVPEGKVFSGWVSRSISEDGKTTLTVVFPPSENGHVVLDSKTTLEPMVLTPLFENATSEGGAE